MHRVGDTSILSILTRDCARKAARAVERACMTEEQRSRRKGEGENRGELTRQSTQHWQRRALQTALCHTSHVTPRRSTRSIGAHVVGFISILSPPQPRRLLSICPLYSACLYTTHHVTSPFCTQLESTGYAPCAMRPHKTLSLICPL